MRKIVVLVLVLCLVLSTNATFSLFQNLFKQLNIFNKLAPKNIREADLPQFARIVRSQDGSNNNRKNPKFGQALNEMPRLTFADYADGKGKMIKNRNPRELSNIIGSFSQGQQIILNQYGLNMLFVLFGQFIDHDLDLVLFSGTEKALISVPRGDPSFDPKGEGNKNIEFSRSKFTLKKGKRFFANQLTSFIDGSQIYGSSQQTLKKIREFKGGRIKMDKNMLIKDDKGAFFAGDIRVNENIGLTSIQTIFAREHNRQCELYLSKYPGSSDETLFRMARNKVIGFIQKITFKDYLPLLLGDQTYNQLIGGYKGYDEDVDATINLEFSTAAFRIGHPLLYDEIEQYDYFNKWVRNVSLKDSFESFRTLKTAEQVDFTINGMMRTQCKHRNNQLVDDLRNLLVELPGIVQDLFSLNVQRGRDHGIPDYNSVRKQLGMQPISSFSEISGNKQTVSRLSRAINNVNNIDLWIGVISEESLPGGNLGEVGAKIVAETFNRIRNGDRFWYEFAYPKQEIDQISQTTFRDIILRNSKLSVIPQGFKVPDAKIQLFKPDTNFLDLKTKFFEVASTNTNLDPSSMVKESQKLFQTASSGSSTDFTQGLKLFDVVQDLNLGQNN